MNELWRALEAEHEQIWRLLDGITGRSGDPPDARTQRRLTKHLVAYQSAHELTEELVLWPVVRDRCRDGAALAAELLQQEHQLKLALHDIDHLSPSEEFTDCLHTLAGIERTHLSYEQSQIWPRMHDELSEQEIAAALRRWRAARATAATRPHPHLPPHPPVLRAVMPVLSLLDRLVHPSAARRAHPDPNSISATDARR